MNDAPAVASTDYMKLFAEQVRTYVPANDYRVLGTDGFGRSDSRENLRHHFEVDTTYVIVAALGELAKRGRSIRKSLKKQSKNTTLTRKKLTHV
ncbi:transketolase-like TK C-terminal-containing protein [Escherichia coli]